MFLDLGAAVGGRVDLSGGADAAYRLVTELEKGVVSIGGREYRFPLGSPTLANFEPFHPFGFSDGRRLTSVRVTGGSRGMFFDRQRLDWQLKAATTPMDGLIDMVGEIGIAVPDGELCQFELVALNVVQFDPASRLENGKARIFLRASPALDRSKIRLGYKSSLGARVVRKSHGGDELEWREESGIAHALHEVDLDAGSLIHAFVSYVNEAQQQFWIIDPTALPNPRRAAYEAFDPGLAILRDCLLVDSMQRNKPASRDFESSISLLASILGFNCIYFGNVPKLQDGPDMILVSPRGDYVILECTILQIDEKLTKLFTRVQMLRARLDRAGLQSRRLLPVVATAMKRANIPSADLNRAAQIGISVVTHEDLEDALNRAAFSEAASNLFEEGIANISGGGQLSLPAT